MYTKKDTIGNEGARSWAEEGGTQKKCHRKKGGEKMRVKMFELKQSKVTHKKNEWRERKRVEFFDVVVVVKRETAKKKEA